MTISAQAEALAEVGDPNGSITPLSADIWELYADKGVLDPTGALQTLYFKRSCINRRMSEEQPSVDFRLNGDELQSSDSQAFDHLKAMYDETQAEIARFEAKLRGRRVPTAALITAVEIGPAPVNGVPDANDPRYRGSPYYDSTRPW